MADQPKHEPLEASSFFSDGAASRSPVPGTVARGDRRGDQAFVSGVQPGGGFVTTIPMSVTPTLLARGRERFNIFCSPCHGAVGDGRGMIVERGFKQPASFHSARLRAQAPGYFVDVITNGFGVMPSYAPQVPPDDRWAIAAYVGALQLSQYARIADLSPEDAARVRAAASDSKGPRVEPERGAP
jgi:mono/diheme cytochrome c family protein